MKTSVGRREKRVLRIERAGYDSYSKPIVRPGKRRVDSFEEAKAERQSNTIS